MTFAVDPAVIESLKALAGPGGWSQDPDRLAPKLTEWRGRWTGVTPLLMLPRTTAEVAAIVRLCAEAGAPITVQGGNTGLVGGQIPDGEVLLSLERLFERVYEDGALDLMALGPAPLELAAFVKCAAQWITAGAPLALMAPIIAISLGAETRLAPLIILTALIGGLGFSFCGGIGAALSLGSRRGGLLIAVIVLPLFVPPVIFGAGAIEAFAGGLDWRTGLLLLTAYSLAAVGLGPFAMASACRNALS